MTPAGHQPAMALATCICNLARSRRCPASGTAFFTRAGGVSTGVYASLNGGTGSNDVPEHIATNRARMAAALDCATAATF